MTPDPASHRRGQPSRHDTGTAADSQQLARALGSTARDLQALGSVDAMLAEIVTAGVAMIPGADDGSISQVVGRRHVTSDHPSGQLPRLIDALQNETGQGPCLDAVFEQETVRVSDMRHEQRWPAFAGRAAELGALSMLAFQLYVEGENLGALNLYGRQAGAFDDESEMIGLIFASHAAVALAQQRANQHLRSALENRDIIGQAKGILMERFDLSADQAFHVLIRVSQDNNVKLHHLADQLAGSRTVPGLPPRGR